MTITRTLAAVAAAITLTTPTATAPAAAAAAKPSPRPSVPAQCQAAVLASLPKGWRATCANVKVTDADPKKRTVTVSLAAWRLAPATAVLGAGQWTGLKPRPAALKAAQNECLTIIRAAAPTGWDITCPPGGGTRTDNTRKATIGLQRWIIDPVWTSNAAKASMKEYADQERRIAQGRECEKRIGALLPGWSIMYGTPEQQTGWYVIPAGKGPVSIDSRNPNGGGGSLFVDMNAYLADPDGVTAQAVALANDTPTPPNG